MPKVSWNVTATEELERQIEKDSKSTRKERKLLDAGYYDDARLIDAVPRESKNGDPQIRLDFEVEGEILSKFPTFSLKGYPYAARDIVNTGVSPDSIPDFDVDDDSGNVIVDVESIAEAIVVQCAANTYRVGVEVSEYEGKNRNEIYWVGVTRQAPTPVSGDDNFPF